MEGERIEVSQCGLPDPVEELTSWQRKGRTKGKARSGLTTKDEGCQEALPQGQRKAVATAESHRGSSISTYRN
jgi:hypothetical protein